MEILIKMIYKKDLKSYEFNSMNDYYQYIIDSFINGQHKQVKNLYSHLSHKQKNLLLKCLLDDISFSIRKDLSSPSIFFLPKALLATLILDFIPTLPSS